MQNKNMSNDLKIFIDSIYKYKSISIIGLDKNTGKTTTLNFLIHRLKNKKIGITSIGRDGEREDIVTRTHKPRIYIHENTLVATARLSFLNSDAVFEILDVLDINTPLGNIVIARSVYPGFVEIAGASTKNQTKYVIDSLNKLGCEIIIVDGALGRKTFADPEVTEAAVLCTGAAFSEDMEFLVEETLNILNLFSIDRVEYNTAKLYEKNMQDCKVAYVYADNSFKKSSLKTSIDASKEIISNFSDNLRFIFIKGILTNNFIQDMINSGLNLSSITFVIEDSTKLFVDKSNYDAFIYKGGTIQVKNSINVIGISVNPISPEGNVLNYNKIFEKFKMKSDIPVFNVMDYKSGCD
ncbi:hypothetical protein [Clostridium tyrobutyricum]|uniref:lysine 5,6-aminomutase reactivase subunit KamB n=1 Tax=Clostridium tyrobutyricum TaxID=1519 RepID=UPI0030CD0873